jgi:hypothetical protein
LAARKNGGLEKKDGSAGLRSVPFFRPFFLCFRSEPQKENEKRKRKKENENRKNETKKEGVQEWMRCARFATGGTRPKSSNGAADASCAGIARQSVRN